MKDLLKKMSQLEASAPKAAPKKKILKESAPAAKVESKNMSLKDMFKQLDEALAPGQKPLPVISKVGSNQTTGAGFLNIDDNSPAGQALQQALGNLAGQNKAEIVVPTQPNQSGQSTQPNQSPNQGGGTIQTSASQDQQAQDAEDQIAERDEGKPGKNFAKIAKKAGKEYGSKAAGERVAGAIRAKLAKQGKLEEEQLDELSDARTREDAIRTIKDMQNTNGRNANEISNLKVLSDKLIKKYNIKPHEIGKTNDTVQSKPNSKSSFNSSSFDDVVKPKSAPFPDEAKIKNYSTSELSQETRKWGDRYNRSKSGDPARHETIKKVYVLHRNELKRRSQNEEVEELDEISKDTANTVKNAAAKDMANLKGQGRKELYTKNVRRFDLASDKLSGKARVPANEEVEELEEKKKGVKEADIPSVAGVDTRGAGLGAGRSPTTLEGKKAKPDFLDLDKDGDKKESMKKAASDKKKKAVKENMSNRIRAARLEGKSHGLKGHSYAGKNYDDMEECRAYHDGYKEGLDECYGMMDECYGMATPHMPATTHGMADQADRDPYTGTLDEMYDDMDEGNAFTAGLARTPHGGKFKLGGKSFTDTSSYDSTLDENDYAFESWNRELETLINEGKKINESKKSSKKSLTEGMTISISKGQQGAPDSVNINATDSEADQVISLIKQAGLGIFGGEGGHEELSGEPRGFSIQAPSSEVNTPGDIEIVDDNEGMLGLMKKLSGIQHDGDDAGEGDEAECENCGMPESECECEEGKLDEVQSEDQMTYEVAEDDDQEEPGQNPAMPQNPSDNGSANSQNATKGNNAANTAAAAYDSSQHEENGPQEDDEENVNEGEKCPECHCSPCECDDDECPACHESPCKCDDEEVEEGLNEWANNSRRNNDENWEADIEFMTKVISGGLNKPKSTGQTTDPVIAGQNDRMHSPLNTKDINESASDWAKLAGIRK